MYQTFVFKIKFNSVIIIRTFNYTEKALNSTLWNGFVVAGFTKLNLILINISDILDKENLCGVYFAPFIYFFFYYF